MNKSAKYILRFLRWFCHPDLIEDVEGDLTELYDQKLKEKGKTKANWHLLWEAIKLFRPGIIRPIDGTYRLNYYGMFKSFIKSGWRNFLKYKQYSLINVFGLSLGFAASLLLYLIIQYEGSYDKFYTDYENIYRVGNRYPGGNVDDLIVTPQTPLMEEEYDEIVGSTRIMDDEDILHVKDNFVKSTIHMVDTGFAKVFDVNVLKGDVHTALSAAGQVVITKSLSEKLYGDEDPMGEVIEFVNYNFDATVLAVVDDPPPNSTIQFELLLSWHNAPPELDIDQNGNWYNTFMTGYVRLSPITDQVVLEQHLLSFRDKYFIEERQLNEIALLPMANEHERISGSSKLVRILSIISAAILLISCINYVNLSVTQLLNRTKEIGVRRVMGSGQLQLIFQFLFEGVFVCVLAIALGLAIVAYGIPVVNENFGYALSFTWGRLQEILLFTFAVLFSIGIISSLIPAILIARHKIMSSIKGAFLGNKEGGFFRKSLIVLQFACSFLLIIGTTVVWLQTQHMKSQDTHFDGSHVIMIDIYEELFQNQEKVKNQQHLLRDELNKESVIISTSLTHSAPGQYWANYNMFSSQEPDEQKDIHMRQITVDDQFFELFKVDMVHGRNFSRSLRSDTASVIINETAMHRLGWDNIDNKVLVAGGWGRKFNVIGVTSDYHYRSLKEAIEPVIHYYDNNVSSKMAIRLHPERVEEGLAFVEQKWSELGPYENFNFKFVDQEYDAQYQEQARLGNTATVFSAVALLMALMGLFTITAYSIRMRLKEIGVRKVLGASMNGIVILLSKNFAWLICIAFVLIVPISYFMMSSFLQDYHYRITINPLIYIITGGAIFIMAMLVVGALTGKAAQENPVNILRNE